MERIVISSRGQLQLNLFMSRTSECQPWSNSFICDPKTHPKNGAPLYLYGASFAIEECKQKKFVLVRQAARDETLSPALR